MFTHLYMLFFNLPLRPNSYCPEADLQMKSLCNFPLSFPQMNKKDLQIHNSHHHTAIRLIQIRF